MADGNHQLRMTHFIEPHNPAWKTGFEELKRVLLKILDGYQVDIQHVGSTAIPGLYAKPILDIDIIPYDKNHLGGIAENLEKRGYQSRGEQGIPGRFAFRQASGLTPETGHNKKWLEHHLYVCYADSLALKNHLLFRDALLKDKRLAGEYSQLKINLAKEKGMTRETYSRKKTDFIISVLTNRGLSENEINQIRKENI